MACDRDNTIGSPPPAPVMERDILSSLPSVERDAVIKEISVINHPSCLGEHTGPCATDQDRLTAWKNLVRSSPYAGYSLLSRNTHPFPWPNVRYFTRTSDDPKISDEVWQQVLAFEWVAKNLEHSQRIAFIEKLMSRNEAHSLVLLEMAPVAFNDSTLQENQALENFRTNLLARNPAARSEENLAGRVKEAFFYRVTWPSSFGQGDVIK